MFSGIWVFGVDRLEVSALKLFDPSVCPVFQNFSHFSLLEHSLWGEERRVRGGIGNWILQFEEI